MSVFPEIMTRNSIPVKTTDTMILEIGLRRHKIGIVNYSRDIFWWYYTVVLKSGVGSISGQDFPTKEASEFAGLEMFTFVEKELMK